MKLRKGGFLVSKIHQLQTRIFAELLKKYAIEDLNPAQGRILFVLWEKDGIPIQEIVRRTSLKKSTLTTMIERLTEQGHVSTRTSERDRRQTLVYLTQKSREYQELYSKVSLEMTELYYRGLKEEEQELLDSLLERVFDNLNAHEQRKSLSKADK